MEIPNVPIPNKKLAVGWFTFTCCEDSTILLTELLNEHLDDWKKVVNFKYIRALKTNNNMENLDVAFIEGAVSSPTQEKEVHKIRESAKYVVAIGSCACTGMPSATRNTIPDKEHNEKMQWSFSHFPYGENVKKLSEVIKVDDIVNGCPMSVLAFTEILNKYLKLFNII